MSITKFRMTAKYVLIFCGLVFLFFSCSERKSEIIYLYPKDKFQIITIISDYQKNKRIVAVGKHITIPKDNYIELNISKITQLGDEIGVCWQRNNHIWELVNHNATIVEINLDTTKFLFKSNWHEDERGIPTPKYYREEDCFTVGMLNYSKHKPLENGYVVRGLN